MLTIDQTIALVSGIATLATAVATFLTIKEIAKQRKASYKPEIIPANQYAYAYGHKVSKLSKFGWAKERISSGGMGDLSIPASAMYSIALFNVGLGSATRIEAKWNLDLSSMIAEINTLAHRSFTSVAVEESLEKGTVQIGGPDYLSSTHMVRNQLKHDWGHLLPASLDRNGIELPVPSAYLELASLKVALGLKLGIDAPNNGTWAELPTPSVELSYHDLGGDRHTRSFELQLKLLAAGHESVASENGDLPSFLHFMARLESA